MPKIVDREVRRREITAAYLRVVARDGGLAATSRAIASELGMASGALWHYFDDFDQVISRAFEQIFRNTSDRIRFETSGLSGLAALQATMRQLLPLEPVTQAEAVVVVTFWGRVASVPSLGGIQISVERDWRELLVARLTEAVDLGELESSAPSGDIADTLLSLSTAQQVGFVVATAAASPERQWALVLHALAPWCTPRADPGEG